MDITCGDCGTSFRLDVALLQGAKGGRFRCRRCGGPIVVRVAEEPPVPVLPPQETIPPSTIEPAATAQEPTVSEADISDGFPPEPVPSPQPEADGPGTDTGRQDMHDPGSADPVPPGMPGKIFSRVEDLFVPPGEDAAPDTVPPEEVPAEKTAATEPGRTAPSRRAPPRSTPLILFVLCLLLLAAGALYFGTTKPGRERLGKVFPAWATPPGSAAEHPYDIRNVKWSIEKETASGTLFVVTGEVANFGKDPSGGIGIRATLLGKDNQALAEKTAFAGNLLDNASMRRMDRPAIEGAMSNRFGVGNVNSEIPPGKALPFMVIFFEPPVEIESVMVKAIDAR